MLINLTIPVYNEEAQLAASVRRVVEWLGKVEVRSPNAAGPVGWEVVMAENGSSDGTRAVAEALVGELSGKAAGVRVELQWRTEAGRGGALKAAWQGSAAEVLSYMDVDLSTDLGDYPKLLGPVLAGEADVVIGSRLAAGAVVRRSWRREVLSRGYNLLLRGALGLRVRDAQCGFKALSRDAARVLLSQVTDAGWFFDTELLWRAQGAGFRTVEVPVRWVEDPDSRVRLGATIWRDLRGVGRLWRERRTGGPEGNAAKGGQP